MKDGAQLEAVEPWSDDQVAKAAPQLAAWYNNEYNRSMMDNTSEITPKEVVELFCEAQAAGGRVFLLYWDGELVGDADFRHITPEAAEFAIMVGPRSTQGRGLGTSFSLLLHHFAFTTLGVKTCYLTIVPDNVAGRRCYEKVGYLVDSSPEARAYADDETDVAMSLPLDRFLDQHSSKTSTIQILDAVER